MSVLWAADSTSSALSLCGEFAPTPSKKPTGSPSTPKPSAQPTSIAKLTVPSSYCESYDGYSTNATTCTFVTQSTDLVIISSCAHNGGECTGDTYLVLYDSFGHGVALNDDRCGICSEIRFTPPSSVCTVYYLEQLCYQFKKCSGRVAITNGYVISNPTSMPIPTPTLIPSYRPTVATMKPSAAPTLNAPLVPLSIQLEALYDFYLELGGDDWNDSSNWMYMFKLLANITDGFGMNVSSEEILQYYVDANQPYGVRFEKGTVVSVSLQFNNLVGTLPESIVLLTGLEILNIDFNYLSGTLPDAVGQMTKLRYLSFRRNFLSGTIQSAIFDGLQWLETLYLDGNLLTGTLPFLNSTAMGFSHLYLIDLVDNALTGSLPTDFCNFPALEVMLAANNPFLCYETCSPRNNETILDYMSIGEIPVCYGYQAESLCAVEGCWDVNSHIPETVEIFGRTSVGDRYFFSVGGETDLVLLQTDVYQYLQTDVLQYELSFDNNLLLGSVRTYDPVYSPFGYVVRIGISAEGSNYLYTYFCGFCKAGRYYYVDEETAFYATGAPYPGTDGAPAFSSFLPYLSVHIYVQAPPDFAYFILVPGYSFTLVQTESTKARMWDCTGSSSGYTTNPCSWYGIGCTGVYVTSISLPSSGLLGTMPVEIANLVTLERIDLSHNSLIGWLPSSLGQLTLLIYFDVSDNALTGSIPVSFADLNSLQYLSLYSNDLGGTLPVFIGTLSNLDTLYLQSNLLQNEVPSEICDLVNATVRIDGNSFGCYQPCALAENSTSINYGGIGPCMPTMSPTPLPPEEISVGAVAGIVVGGVFLMTCLLFLSYRHERRRQEYNEYPLHRSITDGRLNVLTEEFVNQNLCSARKSFRGKTVLTLLLEALQADDNADIPEAVLFTLVDDSMNLELKRDKDLHDNFASPWVTLVQSNHDVAFAVVQRLLGKYDGQAEVLAASVDSVGRRCVDLASPRCKEALSQSLMLHRKFELKQGPPEHKSATSLVRFATMHTRAADDDGASSETVQTSVALKFMKHRAQYVTEIGARSSGNFDGEYVIMVKESYDGESSEDENVAFRASAIKKGYLDYKFCVVMDVADNNLQRVILQQHIAGYDWDMIKLITKSLCGCLQHLHARNVVHGDLKPLNVVMVNNSVRLIDFDASSRFSDEEDGEFAGAKYSSAYIPPELFHERLPGKTVVKAYVKSPSTGQPVGVRKRLKQPGDCLTMYDHPQGYALVRASPSQDMWSLGAILYLLCTGVTLFQASVEDNVSSTDMNLAHYWLETTKEDKLFAVADKYARNLLSLLLSRDPKKRPSPDRVLHHPFLSNKRPGRMVGELPKFDVFISYRVASDSDHATMLYDALRKLVVEDKTCQSGSRPLLVWLDKHCLLAGQPWEEGFCDGLVNSACFVCLLSRNAINHPEKAWQNFSRLEEGSRCDNVLLEWRLALELRDRHLIEGVFPVLIGDKQIQQVASDDGTCVSERVKYTNYFPTGCHPSGIPDVVISSVESKVREHLDRHGLGLPLEGSRSARDVVGAVVANQGGFLRGDPGVAVGVIARTIADMRQNLLVLRKEEHDCVADELLPPFRILAGHAVREDQLLQEETQRLREEVLSLNSTNDYKNMEIERLRQELDGLRGGIC
jgi:serine/threonine protein kinase/Leucine-rich repeat (LRR) protein